MGHFYTNYTLRGPSQHTVAAALAGRSAIVTPAQDGCVIVFDEHCTAFGASAVSEVESILRKSLFDEDGYVFAVERHAELARALGIPSFAAGAAIVTLLTESCRPCRSRCNRTLSWAGSLSLSRSALGVL